MASISQQANGRRTIQFVASDGKRRSLRLGKMSQRVAEAIKFRIEQVNAARLSGQAMDCDTARWIASLDDAMLSKLAKVGLIPRPAKATLNGFVDDYIASRTDVKPATKEVWSQGRRGLLEYFGRNKSVRDITEGDAENYKMRLIEMGLASMTVRKRLQFAKMVFRAMVKHRIIASNPFADVSVKATMDSARQHFITPDDIDRLVQSAPNWEWRTIIGLNRFGGLRCPSEVLLLRWENVDWERNRVTVTSPKTEHHPGKESRVIPLFPELRPFLEEAFDMSPEGAEFVIADDKYRKAAQGPAGWRNCNLRTQFERIIRRAGMKPWPRLFHNLRASWETELAERFPVHVVAQWMGHSVQVATRHYLQTTDEHFNRAIEGVTKAVQNPVQQAHAGGSRDSHKKNEGEEKTLVLQRRASCCDSVRYQEADGEGFEPPVPVRVQQFSRLPP